MLATIREARVDEEEQIQRCIEGDGAAWEAFVRGHAGLVWKAARSVLHGAEDLEDVVQAVFLKLWDGGRRRLKMFEPGRSFSTWLFTVARREALDLTDRKRRRGPEAPLPDPDPAAVVKRLARDDGDPSLGLEAAEAQARLAAAIEALPARDRLLVRLVYEDGTSYAEAARVLGLAEGSVSPMLLRARQKIREYVSAPGRRIPG